MKKPFLARVVVLGCCGVSMALSLQPPCLARQATGSKPDPAPNKNGSRTGDSHAQMNERGAQGMGFSQSATTHHFLLKPDGGVIQVEANSSADDESRDQIRTHLTHIARAFAVGDFDIPMFVHNAVPPGATDLRRLRRKLRYSVEETPGGGRVIVRTSDKRALAALHAFLRFQIEEHHTGDPLTIK